MSIELESTTLHFTTLPLELIEQIIVLSEPRGAARISRCSKYLYQVVYGERDNHLWRSLFLFDFDDPRTNGGSYNWRGELTERVSAENVLRAWSSMASISNDSTTPSPSVEDLDTAYDICRNILVSAHGTPAISMQPDSLKSRNLRWLHRVVGEHAVYFWPWLLRTADLNPRSTLEDVHNKSTAFDSDSDDSTLAADIDPNMDYLTNQSSRWRLMQLAGSSLPRVPSDNPHAPLNNERTRLGSRCFLYDLRNYRASTEWGPWKLISENVDSTNLLQLHVNWQHVNSILNVIWSNIDENREQFISVHDPPMGYLSTRPYSAPEYPSAASEDWAGVQGVWRRIVCFMDYRDLILYNYRGITEGGDAELDDTVFRETEFGEAIRLLQIELSVERVEDRDAPDTVDPNRPTIHFKGVSKGGTPNESTVHGNVRVTPHGDIRWHFVDSYDEVSTFGGEDRWQSSGAQVGGTRSAFGIVGCWSPFQHDSSRDPAGPFWMWKMAK